MIYYTDQLLFGGWAKAAIAAVAAFFIEVLKGDIVVFNIYIAFMCFDLILGIAVAKTYGIYRPRLLCNWTKKLCTHIIIIFLFGLLCNSFFLSSGFVIPAVNWLLFCLSITEFASMLDHLRRLGAPIPPVVEVMMKVLRRQASQKLTSGITDDKLRQEVEDALNKVNRDDR